MRDPGERYDPRALASLDEFLALDVRVGTVVAARVNQGARLPAYALTVDFGPLGTRLANARIAGRISSRNGLRWRRRSSNW